MKIIQLHFGKDGGAERFFVHLVNALAERGVEQTNIIPPHRHWRREIDHASRIIESNSRNLSLDRLLLPMRVSLLARWQKPDAMLAWAPRSAELMPAYSGCIKLSRLGDHPRNLDAFKNTDIIVCNAPGIAKYVRSLGWTGGLEVISNFTRTERVQPADRLRFDTPDNVTVVMAMGRFFSHKGFAVLIDAIAQLPETYLWLAGSGEEEENLRAQVARRGMDSRVRFLGWQKDTRPLVAAADIVVMPSSHEPLGNAILEAWAQDKPVVSTRAEGPQWFMRHEENGLLVDLNDADALADAITRMINNAPFAKKLAINGRKTLMKQFSEEAVANAYIELFQRKF